MIKAFIKKNFLSEFAKNVLIIFSGTSFAQLFPFFVAPILTRIFSPEDFAVLALFTSTALLFGNISTLQYDQAIMLPKEEKDAINLLFLAFLSVTGISIFVLFIVILLKQPLVNLMDNDRIGAWLYLIPVSVFLMGSFRCLNMWASRKKKFKRLAVRNIMQTSTTTSVKLITGFLKYTDGGLIVGSLTGQLAATSFLFRETRKKDKIDLKFISVSRMKANARIYKEFPLYTNWQSFFSMFDHTGSRYIISNFFGANILGLYSFTFSLLLRPLQFIGQSVSQVFYQKISDKYNKGQQLWPVVKKILFRLFIISLPIYIPILFWGKEIFSFVFGENWINAGVYAQILVPWLFAKSLFSPISTIPLVLKRQKQFFTITLFLNLLIPFSFFVFGKIFQDFEHVLILVSLLGFSYVSFIIFWIKKITLNK